MKKSEVAISNEGGLVKPFTFKDMVIVNEQLMHDYSAKQDTENKTLIKYIHDITHRYASVCNRIDIIKAIDQVFENKPIYQLFCDLKEFSFRSKQLGMRNIFWYIFYSMYLTLAHTAYGIAAYEFNMDSSKIDHESAKRRFFDELSRTELIRVLRTSCYNELTLDLIARCIIDNIGEDAYMSMDDKSKVEYFIEYSKASRATFVDHCTAEMTKLLLNAIFDVLLYDEDMSGEEYQKIADGIVPIINDFREDLDKTIQDLVGIFALDYTSPLDRNYYYDDYYSF